MVSEGTVLIFSSKLWVKYSILKINFLFCLYLFDCFVRDAAIWGENLASLLSNRRA